MVQRENCTEPIPGNIIESLKLRIDGHQIHYLKSGNGPSVVFLHGAASNSRDWVSTLNALSPSYSVYAPDMVGFGLSDRHRSRYCLSDFVGYGMELFRELGLDSLSLVGHSLGGRICLEIALRHPEKVRKLVLIDTVGFGNLAWWGMSLGAAAYWGRKVMGKRQPYPRFHMDRADGRHWNCTDRLASLNVSTLIVWNRRDPYYRLSDAVKAKHLIPRARLEVLPGYGHSPHMQYGERFNRLLLDFLNEDGP